MYPVSQTQYWIESIDTNITTCICFLKEICEKEKPPWKPSWCILLHAHYITQFISFSTYLASSQKSVVCKAVIVEMLDHDERIGRTSVWKKSSTNLRLRPPLVSQSQFSTGFRPKGPLKVASLDRFSATNNYRRNIYFEICNCLYFS